MIAALLALSACGSLQTPADSPPPARRDSLRNFSLAGRFSLHHEDHSYIGQISWRHDDGSDELLLSSPLGQALAEIVSEPGGARLTGSDGRVRQAASAEELLQSVVGYPLPLHKLNDWVRGGSAGSEQLTADALGRPLRLRDQGWRIAYEYDDDDPQALPGRLFIELESVLELRLRIDEWRPLPAAKPTP